MAEREQDAPGFDLAGAARDLRERAKRLAPIHAEGGQALNDAIGLLYRNPKAAPEALAAVAAWCKAHPEQAKPLSAPLYPAQG